MTIKVSSGLRASLLSDYGLQAMMNYGFISIYSGDQPDTASMAATGTLLGRVTQNGVSFVVNTTTGGLQTELSPLGGLIKTGTWILKGVATGNAGWWRWQWNAPDDGLFSPFYPRMDGAVGESLILATTAITPSTSVTISDFYVNLME